MPDFHKFMMRHGEASIQYILEQIERNEGIHPGNGKTLEDRWSVAMREPRLLFALAA